MSQYQTDTAEEIRARHVTRGIDDCLNTIIANDEMQLPIILEDRFVKEVLPLLVRPWDTDNLTRYRKYVLELTNPLRVASNEAEPKILFTVPALYPRPATSWAADATTASISHVVDYIAIERERSLQDLEPYITEFLSSVSITTTVDKSVLIPLANILAMYNRTFEDESGNPLYTLAGGVPVKGSNGSVRQQADTSSFDDDYED
ncbi:hypothetical protein [Pseudomonas phage PA1C]|uniref:Uncharacterized protein n=1 Tax=Pseudomonas phage vB_PaeM_PS119XW TaxID=2601632 RepID=A0A5C1K7D0_9CAUD|nr:hypothetical protein PP933_gp061 [Pseudomonas phage vB_PaeM_PS119XW]QBX32212.1 hypothetical protein [Pseudomonas phage PA1C]QEM41790.1 hypothetical protein [Pseudomonas phage vB_PaeM_PS119XW]BEG72700.1 hypothetical protein RVBP21_3280 [Pseudomonas phage BRkr]